MIPRAEGKKQNVDKLHVLFLYKILVNDIDILESRIQWRTNLGR